MSFEKEFTKDNLYDRLKELGKEFRKLNGTKTPAEIILIGGAAILANYGFRESTTDIDAIISASSVMKQAIILVGDKYNMPHNWLNADFKKTTSFTNKLYEVSVPYRTFSNILEVRTIKGEYLIAMKLMSGRQYKHDMSDIAGILWEHKESGKPLKKEDIQRALISLYGEDIAIPELSQKTLNDAFNDDDYERTYHDIKQNEKTTKEILIDFEKENPGKLKGENINEIIKRALSEKGNLNEKINEMKEKAKNNDNPKSNKVINKKER